jgi:hypothetical protein
MSLPSEYRFDVATATKHLTQLAESEPSAQIQLTLAQFSSGGLEGESEIRMPVNAAAALLETVGDDQSFLSGDQTIYVLRVIRAEEILIAEPSD